MNLDSSFHCPRWAELPSIPLYMDQVLFVLEEALRCLIDEEEAVVTPTMINNYVKLKLLPPPEKKKYGRSHIAALIMVSILKRALSMPEISGVLSMLSAEFGDQGAYDLFCEELEKTISSAFAHDVVMAITSPEGAKNILNAALLALLGKLLVQKGLAMGAVER